MSLVSSHDIAKSIHLERFGKIGRGVSWVLMKLLGISRINDFYDKIKNKEGLDFINAILDNLNIEFEIPEDDLKRIPKEGAFITVSNHPLGGLDGILLLKLMLEQRPDYKVLSSYLLQRIEPLRPFLIPIHHSDNKNSIGGIKEALKHFPANGEATISGVIVDCNVSNGLAKNIESFIFGGSLKNIN